MSQNFLALGGLNRRGTKVAADGRVASGVNYRVFGTQVTCEGSAWLWPPLVLGPDIIPAPGYL
jgi:hypothetical protein